MAKHEKRTVYRIKLVLIVEIHKAIFPYKMVFLSQLHFSLTIYPINKLFYDFSVGC